MGASSIATKYRGEYCGDQRTQFIVTADTDSHEYECNACCYCNDTCEVDSCISCEKKKLNNAHRRDRRPREGTNEGSWIIEALFNTQLNKKNIKEDSNNRPERTYTMCQLRRHNHANSAWILVGNTIYDATPYIKGHPGGLETILRKTGGVTDCTEDLNFHSKRAQKEWRKFKVGNLCECSSRQMYLHFNEHMIYTYSSVITNLYDSLYVVLYSWI